MEEVRQHINLAILAGLRYPDPVIQERWQQFPCKGEVLTPEELITYLATHVNAGIDPFA